MLLLWKELKKIIRQVRGKENMFGYKTTTANQLYLLYCFTGEIYSSDKIHRQVKYFWFIPLTFEISVCYFAVITNLWYGTKKDLMMMFDTMNLLGVCNMSVCILPLISYWFCEDIKAMIAGVDEICALRSISHEYNKKRKKGIINVKKIILTNAGIFFFSFLVTFVYLFEAWMFFDEWKMNSRFYYTLSVPLAERYRNQTNFFLFNGLTSLVIVQLFCRCFSTLAFMLYWSMTCHNELVRAADEMNIILNNLNACIDEEDNPTEVWNRRLIQVLIRYVQRLQKISTIIDHFRGFYQVICSITVPTSFFVVVAQLHVAVTGNLPVVLVLKTMATCLGTIWAIFLSYWAAQILENSASVLSLAVYSTPWYRSVKLRKTIYIFLCQTQSIKNLRMTNVFSLLMQNFSRYLHGILSCTNALRKLT
ncbi:uncharacterized protein LOC135836420 isoform X1 [Planococcus citri]|uniref:uncharacterized protein LOC135836420 isoform X1 n=1 Tax=Planococcus citri TaxID=170843 RepID=UPI0031F9C0A5